MLGSTRWLPCPVQNVADRSAAQLCVAVALHRERASRTRHVNLESSGKRSGCESSASVMT